MSKPKLKIMFDYESTGLWNEDGNEADPAEYGLSEFLRRALKGWVYMINIGDSHSEEVPTDFEVTYVRATAALLHSQMVLEIGDKYDIVLQLD